jgi:hypothetical protein
MLIRYSQSLILLLWEYSHFYGKNFYFRFAGLFQVDQINPAFGKMKYVNYQWMVYIRSKDRM